MHSSLGFVATDLDLYSNKFKFKLFFSSSVYDFVCGIITSTQSKPIKPDINKTRINFFIFVVLFYLISFEF